MAVRLCVYKSGDLVQSFIAQRQSQVNVRADNGAVKRDDGHVHDVHELGGSLRYLRCEGESKSGVMMKLPELSARVINLTACEFLSDECDGESIRTASD